MVRLSIIVINKNRAASLALCLEAIIRQVIPGDELIVADDDSSDGSQEILSHYQKDFTHYITLDSEGNRSKVRNAAAGKAQNTILVFVDSDIIIGPNNLNRTREIHENMEIVGSNGNAFAMSYDDKQFEVLMQTSLEEFYRKATEDFEILKENPCFYDYRYAKQKQQEEECPWFYYYTNFATVRKEIYDKIGGFDEAFQCWGGEDSDFAYRLSLEGRLLFLQDTMSMHYVHSHNVFENQRNLRKHFYYMLGKYQNYEMEWLTCFYGNVPGFIREWIRDNLDFVRNKNSGAEVPVMRKREILFAIASPQHPDGYIAYRTEQSEKIEIMNLLGLALPFKDQTFDMAYFSPYYGCLDMLLQPLLFQEALRIAKRVLIPRKRVESKYSHLMQEPVPYIQINSCCSFNVHGIHLYDFELYNQEYYELKWKENTKIWLEKKIMI